jgi:hypothetical protein
MKRLDKWGNGSLAALFFFNVLVLCIWLPSDGFIALKPGQYQLEGAQGTQPASLAGVSVKVRSDLYTPIHLIYFALINTTGLLAAMVCVSLGQRETQKQ